MSKSLELVSKVSPSDRRTEARELVPGAGVEALAAGAAATATGDEVAVRAHIYTINGFSAHADRSDLIAWRAKAESPRTFLVHGELKAMEALAGALPGVVELPAMGTMAQI